MTRSPRRGLSRATGVAGGLLADRLLGEPPRLHPVAGFGLMMGRAEDVVWRDRRGAGVLYTTLGAAAGAVAGGAVRSVSVSVGLSSAGRELRRVAAGIGERLEAGDLEGARTLLPSLVGRDPSELDEAGIAAAVVESLAENSVDAVVAPAFWGLVAGAPGAAAYRAVNTMDAMVGHRSPRHERFGWASARLDDVANYVPARLFAGLVILVRPGRARAIRNAVRQQAPAHPSPNAGVAEAAVAAALGRELGGTLRYGERVEHRPVLGTGPRPDAADVRAAVDLVNQVEMVLVAALISVGLAGTVARARSRSRHAPALPGST